MLMAARYPCEYEGRIACVLLRSEPMQARSRLLKAAVLSCSVGLGIFYIGFRISNKPRPSAAVHKPLAKIERVTEPELSQTNMSTLEVPPEILKKAELDEHFGSSKSDRPDFSSAFTKPKEPEVNFDTIEVPQHILDAAARWEEEERKHPRKILMPGGKFDAHLFHREVEKDEKQEPPRDITDRDPLWYEDLRSKTYKQEKK